MIWQCDKKLEGTAECHILSNDIYWHFKAMTCTKDWQFEHFRADWQGYNDANWWNNVAPNVKPLKVVGDRGTVKYLRIDFNTDRVWEVEGAEG